MEEKKEDLINILDKLPQRKLTDLEKQVVFILIEKSKLQRENSMAIVNKGFLLFVGFVIVAYLTSVFDFIPQLYVHLLFIFGVIMLVVSMYTYQSTVAKEEKTLNNLLNSFLR
jgi:hypothetical protein